ncbi:hypothetical protein WA026_009186 [Henosepilachna vigintioctopunctata]|uniref:Uncharacterized protein n=1 Tax=Henosepilachna vigintioctopunctata TaxID=420089 RepID=A0AAW1UQY9_9CUCU
MRNFEKQAENNGLQTHENKTIYMYTSWNVHKRDKTGQNITFGTIHFRDEELKYLEKTMREVTFYRSKYAGITEYKQKADNRAGHVEMTWREGHDEVFGWNNVDSPRPCISENEKYNYERSRGYLNIPGSLAI